MTHVTRPDLPELEAYIKYLQKIWKNRWLTNNGEFVRLLEKKLADYLKVKNIILTSDGSLGILLTLKALNLTGEVITTPFTFAASTNAIIWDDLKPVFADIDHQTFNIDPQDVERRITASTSAILAVHIFGNPCNVEKLQNIADKYKLKLIYDAAHCFGVEYNKNSILNFGDASILSFHATKVFHTIEGGGIVVEDEKIDKTIRLLRNHGIQSEKEVILPGLNAKMNEFQAAMGLCNLENIDEKIRQRNHIYHHYKKCLESSGIIFQKVIASKFNYGYMPILLRSQSERNWVNLELMKKNIYSRKYFYPLITAHDYIRKISVGIFPLKRAEEISNRILCLPLYPDLKIDKVEEIVDTIKNIVR